MAVRLSSKYLDDLSEYTNEHPGTESFKYNRKFYCWWRLIDDSVWKDLYEQTGVLNGRKKGKYQGTLNRVLTNLFKSDGERVIYLRHQSNYTPETFYHHEGLSYKITKNCIEALNESKLIEYGIGGLMHDEKHSYFQATEKLQEIFKELDIPNSNISYELTWTVYLREAKKKLIQTEQGEVEVDTQGKYLPIKHTAKINTLNRLMVKYNGFLQNFDITWNAPEEARLLHKCLNGKHEPDLFNRSLHCIFNVNMSNGGRMYGAFWINMPKVLRPYLKIQGEPITDIDFNACHIQLLYREVKRNTPDNPYQYKKDDDRRDVAKKLLLTTLNYKAKKGRSEHQNRQGVIYASKVQEEYSIDYQEAKAILLKIEDLHAPIHKYFYTGRGLKLQKEEADIMRKIMKRCIKEDIPVLPCHDGCSVRISDTERTEEIFKEVTALSFSSEDLKGDLAKIRTKTTSWLEKNTSDHKYEEIIYRAIMGVQKWQLLVNLSCRYSLEWNKASRSVVSKASLRSSWRFFLASWIPPSAGLTKTKPFFTA
ncbi:MAG: hypothetical protein GY697_10945 [Desulfobacterales bacterium]|nr:hypothetical protein [Desulfobacterales bacterium]